MGTFCAPSVSYAADGGNADTLLNVPYFKALTSIETVVAKYEFTHPVVEPNAKQGMSGIKTIVTIVDFEWSKDGLLYFARPKDKADATYKSPYHQFVCFSNGRQLYSLSAAALGIRAWNKDADEKKIAEYAARIAKEPPALPEETVTSNAQLYASIYNGFFAAPAGPSIVAPPFLVPGQYLLFSDGVNPAYNFRPCIMGKPSILSSGIPFFKNDTSQNALKLFPFFTSRNADFWSETMELTFQKSGSPSELAVVLTPKTGGSATRRIVACQLSQSPGVTVGNEYLRIDANLAGSTPTLQWQIQLKSLSINGQKPAFTSDGSDTSRYQSILDLDTGMSVEYAK